VLKKSKIQNQEIKNMIDDLRFTILDCVSAQKIQNPKSKIKKSKNPKSRNPKSRNQKSRNPKSKMVY